MDRRAGPRLSIASIRCRYSCVIDRAEYLPDFMSSWSASTDFSSNSKGGTPAKGSSGLLVGVSKAGQPHAAIDATPREAVIKRLRCISPPGRHGFVNPHHSVRSCPIEFGKPLAYRLYIGEIAMDEPKRYESAKHVIA